MFKMLRFLFFMLSLLFSIEEEEGDSASVAYYRAGSADGARPGRYMICMQDLKMWFVQCIFRHVIMP